ncbi:MAG: hypothetical protein K8R54_17910 [Bacteroidales bacterium]|nr:hypothetical protein [Bacteroidales bacterium]
MKIKYILFSVFLLLQINLSAQNLFNKENSLIFTKYLFEIHQYEFATTELEKLVFFNKSDDSLKYLLLKSYRLSGQYDKGINRAKKLYNNFEIMPMVSAPEYTKLLISADKYSDAREFLSVNHNLKYDDNIKFSLQINLLEKKWHAANDIYQENKETVQGIEAYESIIFQGMNLKRKSPFLAGTLSTFVPGMGKVYTSYWKDGLLAFMSISISSWQSYNGFQTDGADSAYGWIFGTVATILYFSNIYGSQKSAKRYNSDNEKKIIHKIKYHLDTF